MAALRRWLAARLARLMRRYSPLPRLRRILHRPRWGNLRRHTPFSDDYGFDRGTPIDRVFIERFLASRSGHIRGKVLEVKTSTYTTRFGGDAVTTADVVDIHHDNRHATVIADLGALGALPANRYDCVVLTQTLQLIPDAPQALRNAWDTLVPGGVLLVTVPMTTKVEPASSDLWRWTPEGLRELISRALPHATTEIEAHGNLITTLAFLHGLAAEELSIEDLVRDDPSYPVIIAAEIVKPLTR